jgi:hypothetical protein
MPVPVVPPPMINTWVSKLTLAFSFLILPDSGNWMDVCN